MIEELHMGANSLLAYFHYCCKGHRPFTLDWNAEDSVSMAALDPYQVNFIKRTAFHVQANGKSYPPHTHASLTALQKASMQRCEKDIRATMSTGSSPNYSSRIGSHVVQTNDAILQQPKKKSVAPRNSSAIVRG